MPDAPSEYDYRTSTLEEDRRRAKEVEARVERARRDKRRRSANNGAAGDGPEAGGDEAAARAIQGHYRCAQLAFDARPRLQVLPAAHQAPGLEWGRGLGRADSDSLTLCCCTLARERTLS